MYFYCHKCRDAVPEKWKGPLNDCVEPIEIHYVEDDDVDDAEFHGKVFHLCLQPSATVIIEQVSFRRNNTC